MNKLRLKVLAALLAGALAIAANARAEVISANADAFVKTGSWGTVDCEDDNFNNFAYLSVKYDYDAAPLHRKAWIRFDLGSLGFDHTTDLANATLKLTFITPGGTNTGTTWEFEVYGLNDGNAGEGWIEGTGQTNVTGATPPSQIVWNNAPANDTTSGYQLTSAATSLGTFTRTGEGLGLLDFSSPALVNFVKGSSDDLVTFIIVRNTQASSGNTCVHKIAARTHATATGPQLDLVAVPEPSTIVLLGTALLGMLLWLRRRKV